MTDQRPYAPSCDRNRDPILAVLRQYLNRPGKVLEVASGTGQHAVFFAEALPHIEWQCSDLAENVAGMQLWLDDASLKNMPPAISLDVNQPKWLATLVNAIFTANSLHIMDWQSVEQFFANASQQLNAAGYLIAYGPFNYNRQYTSASNEQFDQWLAARNSGSAIRDFEAVDKLAQSHGLTLINDHPMPANNRCLVWKKTT